MLCNSQPTSGLLVCIGYCEPCGSPMFTFPWGNLPLAVTDFALVSPSLIDKCLLIHLKLILIVFSLAFVFTSFYLPLPFPPELPSYTLTPSKVGVHWIHSSVFLSICLSVDGVFATSTKKYLAYKFQTLDIGLLGVLQDSYSFSLCSPTFGPLVAKT